MNFFYRNIKQSIIGICLPTYSVIKPSTAVMKHIYIGMQPNQSLTNFIINRSCLIIDIFSERALNLVVNTCEHPHC